jgi:hypothetical protein
MRVLFFTGRTPGRALTERPSDRPLASARRSAGFQRALRGHAVFFGYGRCPFGGGGGGGGGCRALHSATRMHSELHLASLKPVLATAQGYPINKAVH